METAVIDSNPTQSAETPPVPPREPAVPEPRAQLKTDELLPALSRWATLTGIVIMGGLGVTVGLSAVTKYNVAVKAPATIRPAGELRVVQAELEGKVQQIAIKENQPVAQGDAIAYLDDTKLQIQKTQLQGSLRQNQLQLAQIESQVRFLNLQMLAEEQSTVTSVAAAEADVVRAEREHLEKHQTTQADYQEAQTALVQAQDDRARHQRLAAAGAISQAQLEEKDVAVQVAQIRLERAQAALNPSQAVVAIAQQQVAQQTAQGESTLANLRKEREALIQRQAEIQTQLLNDQKELQKIDTDLQNTVIRATSDGVIFKLNLANPNQVVRSGESIAEIAPQTADLVVRAMVANQDIDKVAVGQPVRLRVKACPYPDYGVLSGVVTTIAADTNSASSRAPGAPGQSQGPGTDTSQGNRSFEVVVAPAATTLEKGNQSCPIQPGMEGDASIISRQETFLQFVLRRARLWSSL
jgi:HlyD family secretion protein